MPGLLRTAFAVCRDLTSLNHEPPLSEGAEPDFVSTLPLPLGTASVGNQELLELGVNDEPIQEARRTLF